MSKFVYEHPSLFKFIFVPLFILTLSLTITFQSCDLLDSGDKYEPPNIEPSEMPVPYQDVSVSEDGGTLIFYRTKFTYINSQDPYQTNYDPDSVGIWISNIDGSNLKLVYRNENFIIGRPQFVPNSNYILFNLNSQIVKAPYNGKLIEDNEIIYLTTAGNNFFPSISGDGNLVAFDSNTDSPNGMYFIWTMNINGDNKKRIVYAPESGEIRMPSFNPSVSLIVHIKYILGTGGDPEVFIMDKDGYNQNRLTYNNTWDDEPRINFNDSKILFISGFGYDRHLVITNIDSTKNYYSIPGAVLSACWTPNDKILYIPYLGYDINNGTIWIMNKDGSGKKQITHNYGLVLEGS